VLGFPNLTDLLFERKIIADQVPKRLKAQKKGGERLDLLSSSQYDEDRYADHDYHSDADVRQVFFPKRSDG
jgi:hypothetical protein